MTIEIKAPTFPESVQDGTIATWHKKAGDSVSRDELIVDIETDKVVLEVVAPADGVLAEVLKGEGDTVLSNEVIARLNEGAASSSTSASSSGTAAAASASASSSSSSASSSSALVNPAAQKIANEKGIDLGKVSGTGRDGRITKEDVVNYEKSAAKAPAKAEAPKAVAAPVIEQGQRVEKRVPMTRLRARIAERLLDAKQSTAMLTTFNEVNMGPVMALRNRYKDQFEKPTKAPSSVLWVSSLRPPLKRCAVFLR